MVKLTWLTVLIFTMNLAFASKQKVRPNIKQVEVTSSQKEKFSKRKIRKSIDVESSVRIINEQLNYFRRSYSNDTAEIREKLLLNNYFFMKSLVDRFSTELNVCQFGSDRVLSKCFRYYFKYLSRKIKKEKFLDKIQRKSIKLLATYIVFTKGKFRLVEPKLTGRKARRDLSRFLPSFEAYMQNINYFKYKRKQDQKEENLDQKVLDTINKYYFRKIKRVGRITEREYLFANFNRLQIMEMSKLLDKTMNMMTSSAGEILLQHEDFSEFYDKIEAKEKEIDSLIRKIAIAKDQQARDFYDRQIKKISEEILELRKEVSLFDLQDQINKAKEEKSKLYTKLVSIESDADRREAYFEIRKLDKLIKDKNEEMLSKSTRIELTHGDIYKFTMNWLRIELNNRKNIKERRSQLYKTGASFGDLVMAGYASGLLEGEVITAILELPEMHENYVSPLKQVLRLAGSIGRMFLTINPITSSYATLGFVLFDALKNKKKMERELANEAHLI